jgi:hypothetical protein
LDQTGKKATALRSFLEFLAGRADRVQVIAGAASAAATRSLM